MITTFWDSDIAQTGPNVVANNARYNLRIEPGRSVTFGFTGTHGPNSNPPTSITACRTATSSVAGSTVLGRLFLQLKIALTQFQHAQHHGH